jgi:iduronate 2-sulfatase
MMNQKKISGIIIGSLMVLSVSYGAITASPPVTASLNNTDASKVIGSLAVEADDYLVVLASSNKGSSPVEAGLLISLSNGAAHSPLLYTQETGSGPAVNIWYAKVMAAGDISLTLQNPGSGYIDAAAYVVRANPVETIAAMVATGSDSSTNALSITNTYSFGGVRSGLILEAISTYSSGGAVSIAGIVFDAKNGNTVKRGVGTVSFSDIDEFKSRYDFTGTNRKGAVGGISFTSTEPAPPPPPVAFPDRDRLHPTNTYNVLFIPIDDMRPLINAYGETDPLRPITPSMDRLAASGVMFLNAHCQQAVCNASRASLLTGLRPDTTRCWKLSTHFRTTVPNVITLPQHFGDHGYNVHGIGKIYHGITSSNQDEALSWKDGWANPSTGNTWYEIDKALAEDGGNNKISATDAGEVDRSANPIEDADYNDGNAAELGLVKIAEYAEGFHTKGTPFFLAVGFQKPHLPFNCPKAYWDLYDPNLINLTNYTGIRTMPVGSNKFTAPYGGEPKAFDDVTGTSDNGMPTVTEARHLIHGYLACVSFIDTQIGKLLDALEDPDGNPLTDDSVADHTIIVLWGDHGFHLGDHNGFWAKHSNYEISTRVPLIVHTPAMKELGAEGAQSSSLVELVDIYPTLVDLCSLPAPAQPVGQNLQGTTFLPLLEDPAQPWKQAVFSEFQRTINDTDPEDTAVSSSGGGMGYTIRTERYRYTEWWVTESTDETDRHIIKAGITEPGLIELYDYVVDPNETTNLASFAVYSNLVAVLSGLLNDDDPVSAGDGWKLNFVDAPDEFPVTFTAWQAGYTAPGRDPADLEAENDPDNDELDNRLEYKFGTHPLEPDASPVSNYYENTRVGFIYPDVTNRTDIVLVAETTADLTTNTWTGVGIFSSNTVRKGSALVYDASIPTDTEQAFLRLKIIEP